MVMVWDAMVLYDQWHLVWEVGRLGNMACL